MNNTENISFSVPRQEYKVLVRCFTYNQSKYIEDALNGFAMQQTNFPFVCLVMDDASKDGEQEVIKAWMERECDMAKAEYIDIPTSVVIIVSHKTNASCTFAFYLLKQNLWKEEDKKNILVNQWREKCEYEAICEGDDYWIDFLKLQKQVMYMDANEDCGMCYGQAKKKYAKGNILSKKQYGGPNTTFEQFMLYNSVPTCTALIRMKIYFKYIFEINPIAKRWLMGDYPMWIYISKNNKVFFEKQILGVYRVNESSASQLKDKNEYLQFSRSKEDIHNYFADMYKSTNLNLEFERVNNISMASYFFLKYNDRRNASKFIKNITNKRFSDYIRWFIYESYLLSKIYKILITRNY